MPNARTSGRTRQLAVDTTLVVVAALGVLAVVYRLWDASLRIPFEYLPKDRARTPTAPTPPST